MSEVLEKITEMGDAVLEMRRKQDAAIETLTERVERIEAGSDRPRAANDSKGTADEREHKSRFLDWVRRPRDETTKRFLAEAQDELAHKSTDFVVGTDAQGGFTVPKIISNEIERRVRVQNPFRQLVSVVTASSSDWQQVVSRNAATYSWTAETGSRSVTDVSTLINQKPIWGELYGLPQSSNWALEDSQFDVQEWLLQEVADGFSAAEAAAIWSGSASSQPHGIKHTTPVTTTDAASPERSATAYQYYPLTSSPIAINADDLLEALYSIKAGYMQGPGLGWVMRRSTALIVRQLKDGQNRYIWEPNTQAGQPPLLFGLPVFESDAVDADGSNNFYAAVGNFRRAYVFVQHASGLQITPDPYTTPGYTRFYVRKRVGGIPLNTECLRLLKHSAS